MLFVLQYTVRLVIEQILSDAISIELERLRDRKREHSVRCCTTEEERA